MAKVLFEGDEAVATLAKMPHNGNNANAPNGAQLSPSQQKVILGIFPVTTTAGGDGFAFPNVCKVPAPPGPPVTSPFPSISMMAQANTGTCPKKVMVENKVPCTKATKIDKTSGDEPGVLKGTQSNENMGQAKFG